MNYSDAFISLVFPEPLPTLRELEERYPQRQLPEGAVVTRFGPSPTGFIHIGGVYIATIGKNLARHSQGVYFVRIEDTDQKRKVDDSQAHFDKAFRYFDIGSDENEENASWGPYTQSHRSEIYKACVKHLLQNGKAYPCFCTREELEEMTAKQQEAKADLGYYGTWAKCRHLSEEEATRRINAGEPYAIRFRSPGIVQSVEFEDEIRGTLKMADNIIDAVVLKSSAEELPLPTYHMAHPIDDHFMRVSLVLRAEEWLPSVPLHLQLFDALGFPRIPYAHIAPLMKLDGTSRRKLSKRKDPEASVTYYMEQGYPPASVIIYLKGLANSRIAEMPVEQSLEEPILIGDLQKSGALIDMEKLKDVSSNYVATMKAVAIRDAVIIWAEEFDAELAALLKKHFDYTLRVIDADRFSNGKVRKDLYRWCDFRMLYGFFYNELFEPVTNPIDERLGGLSSDVVKRLAAAFVEHYDEGTDNNQWFENIKKIAGLSNFALNNKEYKENPQNFAGTIKEASHILRVAITGKSSSPNLYDVCHLLGREEIVRRVSALLQQAQ